MASHVTTTPTSLLPGPPPPRDNGAGDQQPTNTVKDPKKKTGTKTLWVTIFKCFHCGKHGHNLPKCRQCSQAYYCDADCQRKHWNFLSNKGSNAPAVNA